jgi:hypothetical protein
MTLKDYITLSISIAAFTISILSLATDTRGLSVNVRGGSLDQETRVYEVQLSMINSGTKEIMIYAPDVTGSKRKQDRECSKNLISSLNAPRLDESYTIKPGAVVHHTLKFKLQSLQPDFWTLCIDFKIADFLILAKKCASSQDLRVHLIKLISVGLKPINLIKIRII